MIQKEWFKDWFASEFYLKVYKHRNNLEAESFLQFIIDDLKIEKCSRILDAACGAGRHLAFLQKKGFNAFGFDLSLPLLKVAKREIENNTIINMDIRTVAFKQQFDYVFNLFTSFGYFETDDENFKFFVKIKDYLKHRGVIVFDYFNTDYLKKNLVQNSCKVIDDIKITETRNISSGRVNKIITLNNGIEEKSYVESVKLYSYFQLMENFEKLGYRIINKYGNYNGENFNIEKSERLILYLINEKC